MLLRRCTTLPLASQPPTRPTNRPTISTPSTNQSLPDHCYPPIHTPNPLNQSDPITCDPARSNATPVPPRRSESVSFVGTTSASASSFHGAPSHTTIFALSPRSTA